MKTKFTRVFYCDHCKKHGLRVDAMERHELHCTLNPERECGWVRQFSDHKPADVVTLAAQLAERETLTEGDLSWLESQTQGCPACMLAALRQSKLGSQQTQIFDYQKQIEIFRDREEANVAF